MEDKSLQNSNAQIEKIEDNRAKLAYLNANQAVCLVSILLNPTDKEARESLGWSLGKFYKYKAQIHHLKMEFAQDLHQDSLLALSLAGKYAVSKLIKLLDTGGDDFQKGIAETILDRMGIIKQQNNQVVQPIVQTVINQKWDQYEDKSNGQG